METKRPTNTFMELQINEPVNLLDHGFIMLKDYMGDEAAVVQAARVSYGAGTRNVREDTGLLRYLIAHRHTTPLEMCEIKLHAKMPIFVARQWVRHRMACLAGDVRLTFDLPSGVKRSRIAPYHLTVKEIYDRFQPSVNSRSDKQGYCYNKKDRIMQMYLRNCDEDNLCARHTHISNVWETGEKPVIKVLFANGGTLRASADHLCFTEDGWIKLSKALKIKARFACNVRNQMQYIAEEPIFSLFEIKNERWSCIQGYEGLEVSSLGRVRSWVNTRGVLKDKPEIKKTTPNRAGYRVVGLSKNSKTRTFLVHHLVLDSFGYIRKNEEETRHLDNNRANNRLTNLAYGTTLENAADRMLTGNDQVLSIGFTDIVDYYDDGEEMTYDIEVIGPHHNFLAGGVFVHNSINEVSARYSILDKEFYVPADEDMAAQSSTNKQGRGQELTAAQCATVRQLLMRDAERTYSDYEALLGENKGTMQPWYAGQTLPENELTCDGTYPGLARELARMALSLNFYTQWYWKTDLKNLLDFIALRADSHAQKEVRVYAEMMAQWVAGWLPNIWQAHCDYRRDAVSLPGPVVQALQRLLRDGSFDEAVLQVALNEGCSSDRERQALQTALLG